MKNILLSENQVRKLMYTSLLNEAEKYDIEKDRVKKLIEYRGVVMISKENDEAYKVYQITNVSDLINDTFVVCMKYKNNKTSGGLLIKPLSSFKEQYIPGAI